MRNVNGGWLIRYCHANGASMFFILVYLHIARGLYYGSYTTPRKILWSVGVIIYFLMIITAFLGYVLPWGQMSFWGATVITNMLSAIPWIGHDLVEWVWGGFSVDNATLNRFYSFHYLCPFLLTAFVVIHLISLHVDGSSNPLGISSNADKITFHVYYTYKDLFGMFVFLMFWAIILFYYPAIFGHSPEADPLVTPAHIQPEWYFLPFYAILRAIPNKLLGVVAMVCAIFVLFLLPFIHTSIIRSSSFRPFSKKAFWFFSANFILLAWLGGQPAEVPYNIIAQIGTFFYFLYFLVLTPLLGYLETIAFSQH